MACSSWNRNSIFSDDNIRFSFWSSCSFWCWSSDPIPDVFRRRLSYNKCLIVGILRYFTNKNSIKEQMEPNYITILCYITHNSDRKQGRNCYSKENLYIIPSYLFALFIKNMILPRQHIKPKMSKSKSIAYYLRLIYHISASWIVYRNNINEIIYFFPFPSIISHSGQLQDNSLHFPWQGFSKVDAHRLLPRVEGKWIVQDHPDALSLSWG